MYVYHSERQNIHILITSAEVVDNLVHPYLVYTLIWVNNITISGI